MSYAIISVGGKQYRVQEGERLLVDRLRDEPGSTITPQLIMTGGDGDVSFDGGTTVTARVVEHVKGDKIRIGKYRRRTGYKRHTGFRSALTQIEIESIGAQKKSTAKKETPKAEPAPKAAATAAPAADKAAPAPAAKPARQAHPPKDYDELTVAQIAEQASSWRRPQLEAALAHEQEHAKRKGAIAALESALKEKES